ncbi:MAG TPA: tyrosine-type recombinase/integrase [Terrimicrobiaceae bacterium]
MSASPSFEKAGECLYRNPASGTYFARVKLRGKEIKQTLETKNLTVARRKLKDFKTKLERTDPAAGRITLKELADRFEKTIQHFASDTIANKTRVLNRVRETWPAGADRIIGKIKPSEAGEFLSRYQGVAGYNQALETIRAMFDLAEADGMIARSPVSGMKQRRREKPIRLAPTSAEFRAIVESIRAQKFADTADESADFIEFLGLAGLGQAEASALTWADINFERGQLLTFRQKTRTGFAVPIFPQLRPLLEKRLALAADPSPGDKVFAVADAKKALAGACARLKLPNYSSRALRRMFITSAIERGVDVKVIAQWQGHQDGGKLILDTYSHVRPAHSERMAQLMTSDAPEPGKIIPIQGVA